MLLGELKPTHTVATDGTVSRVPLAHTSVLTLREPLQPFLSDPVCLMLVGNFRHVIVSKNFRIHPKKGAKNGEERRETRTEKMSPQDSYTWALGLGGIRGRHHTCYLGHHHPLEPSL